MKVITTIYTIIATMLIDIRSSISTICTMYDVNNLKKQHVHIHKSTFNKFRR